MAKKLPKKPKAPKTTASLATWEKYEARLKDWAKKCSDIKNDAKRKESLIKKLRGGHVSTTSRPKRRKAAVSGTKRKTAKRKTQRRR